MVRDELLDAVCSGLPRDLAGDTPVGKRGWPGRSHRAISCPAWTEHRRQTDGLLQLPQCLGRRADCLADLPQNVGPFASVAGAFRGSVSARAGSAETGGLSTKP